MFGITQEVYEQMAERQDCRCAICGTHENQLVSSNGRRTLYVDHDHATGAIRELLCRYCNTLLGQAKESPTILRAAIDYLLKHRAVASS
jgi:hypothetical protein